MWLRLTHYTTALIFLLAMSVIYQNVIAPTMQPPKVAAVPAADHPMASGDDLLGDLFAEGTWQRGLCKQLQTSDGILLFENWKQLDGKKWKLWPVTVVFGRGMSGVTDRVPIVLDAPEGAEIEFTDTLDVFSGGAPPIQHGRMIGPVHIYRKDGENAHRTLDLRASNVGIDNRKIWTTETIVMSVGQARMVGRDLTLHLSAPAGTANTKSPTVLDRMELIYLDEFKMPLKNGLWSKTGQDPSPGSKPAVDGTAAPASAMLSIQCGGRVEYDFALDHLALGGSVSLIHQVSGVQADRFDCDTLELLLNDPTSDLIARESPIDWVTRIIATGSMAVARLPSFDAELAAERIEFDAESGVVHASGRKGIQVRRGGITARLARLNYKFDPANPEAIGAIHAPGAGIVRVDDPSIPIKEVRWRESFRLRPLRVSTVEALDTDVELDVRGDFHAWLADGGEFKAGVIHGYFKPQKSPDDHSMTLVPNWFEITDQVQIDTTAISAQTQLLRLFFVADDTPAPQSVGEPANTPSSLRQWVAQPRDADAMVDPVARPRPVIRGDAITAKLRSNDAGLSAKDLSVVGNVTVEHQLNAGGQTLPARLTGQQLQLQDGGGQDVLELTSGPASPARFDLGDGFFVGPKIQIRPSDNVIWMPAAGEFQMPTAALPNALSGSGDSVFQWTVPPHCRWQGEMIFDGRTAVLTDGVDVTASLVSRGEPWHLQMTGDRLQVDLSQQVQVRDFKSMRSATLEKISLLQADNRPVMMQALRRAPDGVLESKHLMRAMQLTLTPEQGGRIIGAGPGWYRGWTTGSPDDALGGRRGNEPAPTATLIDGADRPLTGIHLIFNDSMQADLASKHLDFLRGVRVGIRDVDHWEDAFDARSMDAISVGQSTLDCDRLRFNVQPGTVALTGTPGSGKTPWEMEATGGVVFRTRSQRGLLEGSASRAAYSSSKDLFTAQGAPNRAAIFRNTLPDGSPGNEASVRTMSIRLGTFQIVELVPESAKLASPPGGPYR